MAKKKDEETGGQLGDYPNDKYRLFFEKFPEIKTLNIKDWKPVHILSYFCQKYEEQYKIKYSFKFNSPSPTKCFEIFHIKRLAMLLSSNSAILKAYIDWVYENKVIKAKRRLTSISFMTNEGLIHEYKNNVLLAGKKNLNVDRSTTLPDNFKSVFQEIGIFANTYGDLAFLSQMERTQDLELAFIKLKEIGFDQEILGRIV